MLLKTIELIH